MTEMFYLMEIVVIGVYIHLTSQFTEFKFTSIFKKIKENNDSRKQREFRQKILNYFLWRLSCVLL
jgi:hypothetical protein